MLRNYALQVALTGQGEQLLTHSLDVIAVQQTFTAWDQTTQPLLPIRERQVAQVLALAEQEIKSVVARLTSAKEEISELRIASLVQANDLSIEHYFSGSAL